MNNTHPCAGKCRRFKEGRQCSYCLINETLIQGVYLIYRTEHQIDHIVEPNEMGDDAHIENHILPLCLSDSRKNESQSPLSIKQDALSRMESCYIEQKKHVELLQTEVTRLNSTVERLKVENVVLQAKVDELQAENKILNQAASTHPKNQMHFKKLYDALVEQLYPYALSLDEHVDSSVNTPKEFINGYDRARECAHYNLLEMMKSDEEYIRAQCGMLGGGIS